MYRAVGRYLPATPHMRIVPEAGVFLPDTGLVPLQPLVLVTPQ